MEEFNENMAEEFEDYVYDEEDALNEEMPWSETEEGEDLSYYDDDDE